MGYRRFPVPRANAKTPLATRLVGPWTVFVWAVGCSHGPQAPVDSGACVAACTPTDQQVSGVPLSVSGVELVGSSFEGSCSGSPQALNSAAQATKAFPDGGVV